MPDDAGLIACVKCDRKVPRHEAGIEFGHKMDGSLWPCGYCQTCWDAVRHTPHKSVDALIAEALGGSA